MTLLSFHAYLLIVSSIIHLPDIAHSFSNIYPVALQHI